MKMMYTNIDGLVSKLNELKDYIREEKPQVVCLTETKLNPTITNEALNLTDYNIWRKDRNFKSGGGVMILTRKDLIVKIMEQDITENVELLAVEVITKDGVITVATLYMPPKTRAWENTEYSDLIVNTVKDIQIMLQKVEDKSKDLVLVGDFNSSNDWVNLEVRSIGNQWNWELMEVTQDFLLTQHIKSNTRVRGMDQPSLLDLLFTRQENQVENIDYEPPLGKSDHVIIKWNFIVKYDIMEAEDKVSSKRNYKKGNYLDLRRHFKEIDWEKALEDENINKKYTNFCNIYNTTIDKYIPQRKINTWKEKQWFNEKCMEVKNKRDVLWNRFRRHGGQRAYSKYKKVRNEYTRIRREAQTNYEKDIVVKCQSQPKLFYSYVKSKIKVTDKIQSIMDEGTSYTNEEDICEIFNKKFQSVFTKEKYFSENIGSCTGAEKLENISINKEMIEKELKEMDKNKASGPDEISCWVLKECAEELSVPLMIIFDDSLRQGKLPECWKWANIVPLYKKGSKQDPLNYRPVSLTSVVCKILERIIRKQWVDHLERKELISQKQFGFRKGRSCVTNLLSFYTRISESIQERDGWVDSIYLDFKKAFDRVPHQRLIWKLGNNGGIQGKVLQWMEDFLSGRKMRTVLRGRYSSWLEITSGVPQGSVLAPVMFLIYINDLQANIDENSYINMFADDAKIQRKVLDENCCRKLQDDMNKLHEWSKTWQMEFNVNKCHVIKFGKSEKRPQWNYTLGNVVLMESDKERDLGVTVSKKLSPEDHINEKVRSAYALLANLKVAFTYVDIEMVKKIITSFIRPTLEYAAVVWSPHLKKHIAKLEKVQRAVTRWVPELRNLSYEERLEKLELPKLEERRIRGDMITLYKCLSGREKIDKEDMFEISKSNLRGHSMKIAKRRGDKDVQKYSFPNRAIDQWNALPEEVVCAKSIHKFKEKYDNWILKDGTIRA